MKTYSVNVAREGICAGDDAQTYGGRNFERNSSENICSFIDRVLSDEHYSVIISRDSRISLWGLDHEDTIIAKIKSQFGKYEILNSIEIPLNDSMREIYMHFFMLTEDSRKLNEIYIHELEASRISKSISRNKRKKPKKRLQQGKSRGQSS